MAVERVVEPRNKGADCQKRYTNIVKFGEKTSDRFRVAIDGVKRPGEPESQNCTDEENTNDCLLLPWNIQAGLDEEGYAENEETGETNEVSPYIARLRVNAKNGTKAGLKVGELWTMTPM